MRYKATFIAGLAIGFVAGARAGRDTYDKIVKYAGQVAGHPRVQQATSAVQAKTTDLANQAAAKAPDYAKSAVSGAASTVSTAASTVSAQVPKFVANVRQTASGKIPQRFGGSRATAAADPAADGTLGGQQDDIAPDGNLIYPAEDGSASANGIRYSPDAPTP